MLLDKFHKYADCYITGTDEGGNYYSDLYAKISDVTLNKDKTTRSIKLWFNEGQKAWFQMTSVESLQLQEKQFPVSIVVNNTKVELTVTAFSDLHAEAIVNNLKIIVHKPVKAGEWCDFSPKFPDMPQYT
jgi:hypothetical protein